MSGEGSGAGGAGAAAAASAASEPAAAPLVRVVTGDPDAIELAALIAGLTAASAAAEEEDRAVRHRWTDRAHALRGGDRGLPVPGADTWRWSLHP